MYDIKNNNVNKPCKTKTSGSTQSLNTTILMNVSNIKCKVVVLVVSFREQG